MHWSICMGKMFLEMWEKYFQSTKHTAKQSKINMKRIYGFLTDKIKHMKSFSHNWMRKIYQSGNLYGFLTFEFYLVWNCDDMFFFLLRFAWCQCKRIRVCRAPQCRFSVHQNVAYRHIWIKRMKIHHSQSCWRWIVICVSSYSLIGP